MSIDQYRNKIICLGAGVNSTALLLLAIRAEIDVDGVIFADTGGEFPETYHYLDSQIEPACIEAQIPFYRVKSERGSLYDYYYERRIIPTRIFRHCTDHFKIQPIRKKCRELFRDDWKLIIGISAEESQRAKNHEVFDYPLLKLGIDREGCKKIIRNSGWPIPRKSGCFFCPFMSIKNYRRLLKEHPDLFAKAEALEKNCRRYPELTLKEVPLEKIRLGIQLQKTLDGPTLDKCVICEV